LLKYGCPLGCQTNKCSNNTTHLQQSLLVHVMVSKSKNNAPNCLTHSNDDVDRTIFSYFVVFLD